MTNYFDLLPDSLKNHIYEYDPTYSEYFKDQVALELWCESIIYWSRNHVNINYSWMDLIPRSESNEMFHCVMRYLINAWFLDIRNQKEREKDLKKEYKNCKVVNTNGFNASDINVYMRKGYAEGFCEICFECNDDVWRFRLFNNRTFLETFVSDVSDTAIFEEVYCEEEYVLLKHMDDEIDRYIDIISPNGDILDLLL